MVCTNQKLKRIVYRFCKDYTRNIFVYFIFQIFSLHILVLAMRIYHEHLAAVLSLSISVSLLAQILEKIEQRWAFLDNNFSTRHQCSRSALCGSLASHGAILLQLRWVSHFSLNSLKAKLQWTRFWQASLARSVHWSACLSCQHWY